ncbi:MAG: glycosyltransferase family 4 protein [Pyrinomonadaceae bacterium]
MPNSNSPAITNFRTLYLCYFGLREPLVQTQVLPYLREIAKGGYEIYLLTFEPEFRSHWTDEEIDREKERLANQGIKWLSLPYHKRPSLPSTLYDIAAGARLAAKLVRQHKIEIIHARSHVAAAMGALAKKVSGGQLIFDIRGFMPEEYVDAGVWPAGGRLYRLTKAAERRLFKSADAFVVLTEQARRMLFGDGANRDARGRPIEVIPCCVDLCRFSWSSGASKQELKSELKLDGCRVIVYVGALGGWYLTDEMAEFLAAAHRQDAATFSLILTQSRPEMIARRLRSLGVAERDYMIRKVAPNEIPRYLRAADFALSFIKPCYSKRASSPTKIAEYLAAGLPVISNAGIGDLDEMIESDRVGVIVREFNEAAYLSALTAVERLAQEAETAARCAESAAKRFDLEGVGGEAYRRLYRRLLENAPSRDAEPA